MEKKFPDTDRITRDTSFQHLLSSVQAHEKIDSTMQEAWRLAQEDPEEVPLGQVIVADHQTEGRGRHGRKWYSPAGSGIWVSILLKAKLPNQHLYPHLTVIGALAVVEAVKEHTNLTPEIRWPNDVVFRSHTESDAVKKFAGVLVETKQIGNQKRQRAVVGSGINVNIPQNEFPEELQDEATSLQARTGEPLDRNELLRSFLVVFDKKLDELYKHNHKNIDDEWSEHSAVINKRVQIRSEERLMKGTVQDVSLENGLTLRMDEGGYRIFEPSHVDELRIIPVNQTKQTSQK